MSAFIGSTWREDAAGGGGIAGRAVVGGAALAGLRGGWPPPGLTTVAEQFASPADKTVRKKQPHLSYLDALLDAEVEERDRRAPRGWTAHLPYRFGSSQNPSWRRLTRFIVSVLRRIVLRIVLP